MKLLIDMCLPRQWAGFLQAHGMEALHWSSAGKASAPDTDIIDYALAHGWVVLTHDKDFPQMLFETQASGPSVVHLRTEEVLPREVGDEVVRVLNFYADSLQAGALVVIGEEKERMRLLPLPKRRR